MWQLSFDLKINTSPSAECLCLISALPHHLSFSCSVIHPLVQLEQLTASLATNPSWHGLPPFSYWGPVEFQSSWHHPQTPGWPWRTLSVGKSCWQCAALSSVLCWPWVAKYKALGVWSLPNAWDFVGSFSSTQTYPSSWLLFIVVGCYSLLSDQKRQ